MQHNPNNNPELVNQEITPNEVQVNIEQVPDTLRNRISEAQWASLTYEQRDILLKIDNLPSQLNGVVPESVWKTLSFDQKLEFLYTHGVLPKDSITAVENRFEGSNFDGGMGETELGSGISDETSTQEVQDISGEVDIREGAELKSQFQEAVERVEEIESAHSSELGNISTVEGDSIPEQESKVVLDNNGDSIPTLSFSGYEPDQSIVTDPDKFSDGPANVGATWIAQFLVKLRNALSQPS